jgi:hypothetical protein
MARDATRTLILVGFEGPELTNATTQKLYWHPTAADPHWRALVKRALVDFLRRSAQDEWRWDASGADVAVFRDAAGFSRALGKNKYDRVVVYSHGDENGLMAIIKKPDSHVRPYALAKALAEAGVSSVLLLGCHSRGLAETAARVAEGHVRIGGIEPPRTDDVTKAQLTILNMIIWGYGGRGP